MLGPRVGAAFGFAAGALVLEEIVRGIDNHRLSVATLVLAGAATNLLWTYWRLPFALANASRARELNQRFLAGAPASYEPLRPTIADRLLAGILVAVLWAALMAWWSSVATHPQPWLETVRQAVLSGTIFAVLMQSFGTLSAAPSSTGEPDPTRPERPRGKRDLTRD